MQYKKEYLIEREVHQPMKIVPQLKKNVYFAKYNEFRDFFDYSLQYGQGRKPVLNAGIFRKLENHCQ